MDAVRGSHTTFTARFSDHDGEPLVASNEVESPTVQIKDSMGEVIMTGVGRPIDTNGTYSFIWFVPDTIELNIPEKPYRIDWFFTDLNSHTLSAQQQFNVVDSVIPDLAEAQFTYLVRDGMRERVILSLDYEPTEISVVVTNAKGNPMYMASCVGESEDAKESVPISERKIGHLTKNGLHYYWFMTDPLRTGEYLVFWDVREDTVSEKQSYQQTIRVPEINFWLFVKPLQLLIDKLRKRYVTFQAYGTDQLYEFIIRGIGLVNGINPVSSWNLDTIPVRMHMGVAEAVILAAAKYALISQSILEEELSFDHGGQTVTLNVKHDYGTVIGYIDTLLEKFSESKLMIQRISCKVGTVGVRPYRYGFSNRVFRLGVTGSPQDNFYGVNALLAMINI